MRKITKHLSLLLFIGLAWGQESKFDSLKNIENLKSNKKLLDEKKRSISLGLGGNRSMSLIGITRDIKVRDDVGIFFGGGWSVPFLGIGAYFQPNYNKTGFNGSLALGPSFSLLNTELSFNLNYQVQLSKSGFISLGISTGFIERSNFYSDPTCCDNYILPALSYHFRL